MINWIKELWGMTTLVEKIVVAAILVLAVLDFLGGNILQAIIGAVVALIALIIVVKEMNNPIEVIDEMKEGFNSS